MMATRTLRVVTPVPSVTTVLGAPRLPTGVGPSKDPKAPPVSPPRRNPFAEAARERKTAYLVLEAVALAKRVGCSLTELADTMERWTDLEWNQLAIDAGQHPPKTSRPEVLRLLRVRAAKEAPPEPAYVTRFFVVCRDADRMAQKHDLGSYETKEEADGVADRRRALGITSGSGFPEDIWIEERRVRS